MAYDFDGSGDYISITKSTAATDLSVYSYSFHAFVDSTATTNRCVFWMGGSWEFTFGNFVQTNSGLGKMTMRAGFSTTPALWSVTQTNGQWQNHVITYDQSSSTNDPLWYLDGTSTTVTENVAPSGTSNAAQDLAAFKIGAGHDGSYEYFDGKIAELAIWNRILTAGEAAILGKGFSPLFIPNGLVFYAPMIRSIPDMKSGNVGTATNAVVFPHPRIIYPFSPSNRRFTTAAAASGPANLKTWHGLAKASIKTMNGLAIASVKTFDGLA